MHVHQNHTICSYHKCAFEVWHLVSRTVIEIMSKLLYLLQTHYVPLSSQISPPLLPTRNDSTVLRHQSKWRDDFHTSCTVMKCFMRHTGNCSVKQLFQLTKLNYTHLYKVREFYYIFRLILIIMFQLICQ